MSPLFAGLIFSVPLVVLTSRAQVGHLFRRMGLLTTPDEWEPPFELETLRKGMLGTMENGLPGALSKQTHGLATVLIDPYLNGVHVSLLRQKKEASEKDRLYFRTLSSRLLRMGPGDLDAKEQLSILRDARSVSSLHRQLWVLPSPQLNDWWNRAMREYNLHTRKPFSAIS
jgi:membrane glycosyltransferase